MSHDPYVVTIDYTNWRGERSLRRIKPRQQYGIRYGTNEWHKECQWLLRAIDMEKGEECEFAMKDIHHWGKEGSGAIKMHGGFIDAHGQAVQPGDKVLYQFKPGVHTIGEIMPDGDAEITYDDGTHDCVKWVRCCRAPSVVGKEGPEKAGAGLTEEMGRLVEAYAGPGAQAAAWDIAGIVSRNAPAILAAVRASEAHGEAVEALRPFAREADTHDHQIPDHMFIDDYEGEGCKTKLTVGDLRRARAVLAKLDASQGTETNNV